MAEKVGSIYLATNNANGKQYAGQTIRTVKERWYDHCYCALHGITNNSAIDRAIAKYGADSFTVETIAEGVPVEELCALETEKIIEYGTLSPNGYNLVASQEREYVVSEETRAKLSAASKRGHAMSSPDRYAKIGMKSRGKHSMPMRPNTRAALLATHIGKKRPDDVRRKISASAKRRASNRTPEEKAAISAAISEGNHKRFQREEERRLASERLIARWEDPEYRERVLSTRKANCKQGVPVVCVETGESFPCISDAAKAKGIKKPHNIGDCLKGRRQSAGGYHWAVAERRWNKR